eukprot:m.55479 g.55479  ORF g.55479 m.55479 type:complete len:56 (+) comp7755_c0_seq2:1-168(+)
MSVTDFIECVVSAVSPENNTFTVYILNEDGKELLQPLVRTFPITDLCELRQATPK